MRLPKITKKRIIIATTLVIPIALFFVLRGSAEEGRDRTPSQETPGQEFQEIPDELTFEETPTNRLIEINDVSVNNFFLDKKPDEAKYSAIISNTDNYSIEYQNRFNKFLILITGDPFNTHRADAENDLIDTLGIDQEEACQLNVEVTAPYFAHPEEAGNIYGLSFCN